jgi:phosphate uptake regulator
VREIVHGQLEQLGADLAVMCGMASEAMARASRGLLDADLALVEQVITDDARINQLAEQVDDHACSMLALQSPVARDLRTVVTAIKAAERIERLSDPPYPIQVGVDMALLARYLERFSDQAVAVAKSLDYVVTGAMPEHPQP